MAHAHTPMHVSALSQQFNHVAIDSSRALPAAPTTPPKPRPSSKRKGKSDLNPTASSGSEAPQLQQQQQPRPKQRSPKANKVNGVKNFSTPSKPTAIPNGHPPPAQPVELASHYAGPTFHSSPAPSSLPMPSFLASRPTATSKSAIPVGYDPGTWSPPNQSTPVKPNRLLNGADYRDQDDSPLGPLFRADREEKNRLRSLNSAENRAMGSPTQRPASAGGIPDHLNLYRSESPVPQNGPYQRLNTQTDLKSSISSSRTRIDLFRCLNIRVTIPNGWRLSAAVIAQSPRAALPSHHRELDTLHQKHSVGSRHSNPRFPYQRAEEIIPAVQC